MMVKRFNIEPIEVTAKDIAEIFMDGDSKCQATILLHMANVIEKWSSPWSFQCDAIARDLAKVPEQDKQRVLTMLKTLVDYLKTPPAELPG